MIVYSVIKGRNQRLNHIHDSLLAINSQSLSETTNDVWIHILRKPLSANSQCCFEQKTDERYLLFTNIIRYNVLVHRPDELGNKVTLQQE